jgi:hypothetical protein
MSGTNGRNRHPADDLADVREELKRLGEREAVLREYLIAHPDDRHGARFVAELKDVTTARVDLKELRAMYPTQVAEHTYDRTVQQLRLLGIGADGEVLSAREARKQEKNNV